jgi:5-methylcytosine-specific restriction protein A
MTTALFINGIYESVLSEILAAEETLGGGICYLQPYKSHAIAMLRQGAPSPESPIRLYISTTANLSNVCYTAEIIGWEDKRELSTRRRKEVNEHLRKLQPTETDLFEGVEKAGKTAVNLISIRNLKKLDSLYATNVLKKASDDLPLKKRKRSGSWSEVYDLGDLLSLPTQTREQSDSDLAREIAASLALSPSDRAKRLARAAKVPERIQIISVGFRRNADVIVTALIRANGFCEKCRVKAPFLRRSDRSPYLEVHHWLPLSQGGEDTVENAAALCPNCHRKLHHGELCE